MINRITLLALVLLSASCGEEKLRVKSNIQELSRQNYSPDQVIPLSIESNASSVQVISGTEVLSNGESFSVDSRLKYGINRLKLMAYGESDTTSFPFTLTVVPSKDPQVLNWTVLKTYPHPTSLFTQGLVVDNDWVLESSGQFRESALSRYKLGNDRIVQQHRVPDNWFAEGLALAGDSLYQITWRQNVGMSYTWDGEQFTPGSEFQYSGFEGWGLTADESGEYLLLTDGTARIRRVDPVTKQVVSDFYAVSASGLLGNLNENEMYRGLMAVNLWQTNRIAFIDTETGVTRFALDLDELAENHRSAGTLNGIAVVNGNLLITGKNWPLLYELDINWPEEEVL